MSCIIEVAPDGNFIILTIEGEINRHIAMEHNLSAHALGKKMNINRFLVDVRAARNVESVSGNHKFAYRDMHLEDIIDKSAIIATLTSPGDHSHDFMETVTRNAGFNVKLFTDREEAIQYLLNDTQQPFPGTG